LLERNKEMVSQIPLDHLIFLFTICLNGDRNKIGQIYQGVKAQSPPAPPPPWLITITMGSWSQSPTVAQCRLFMHTIKSDVAGKLFALNSMKVELKLQRCWTSFQLHYFICRRSPNLETIRLCWLVKWKKWCRRFFWKNPILENSEIGAIVLRNAYFVQSLLKNGSCSRNPSKPIFTINRVE